VSKVYPFISFQGLEAASFVLHNKVLSTLHKVVIGFGISLLLKYFLTRPSGYVACLADCTDFSTWPDHFNQLLKTMPRTFISVFESILIWHK